MCQNMSHIHRRRAVESRMCNPRWAMMVGNGLNCQMWDPPQPKQICTNFCVRTSQQFFFSFEEFTAALLGKIKCSQKFLRHLAGKKQLPDIMEKGSDNRNLSVLWTEG